MTLDEAIKIADDATTELYKRQVLSPIQKRAFELVLGAVLDQADTRSADAVQASEGQ